MKVDRIALVNKAGSQSFRTDGYVNLLNKSGAAQDNSEAYRFQRETTVPDLLLTQMYEGNGLFAKIIDTPAEEAMKHSFDLGIKDPEIGAFTEDALDRLEWDEKGATAIKWARLFGGSIAVMLVDDGGKLEDPLRWKRIKSIDEIRVYERALVQPDYSSMYQLDGGSRRGNRASQFCMPEYYDVLSRFGSFRVHESRCLIFCNGVLPERISNPIYQFWGMPEYIRIKRDLQEAITAHRDGTKLLERSVQAIYKMKNLATLLATDDGENQVLKRLQVIDMARGLLNSIAIDSEGEDYDFKNFQFSGIRDVIDATCNMLSAITNIPQTILFGRSPAGMNSTGESDFENYYNYIERIQRLMLKRNTARLLDVIYQSGVASGDLKEVPKYKLKFNPLWSLSETEQANVDKTKADTEMVKAQTAQIYVDMQALDPQEVREGLKREEGFSIQELIDDESGDLDDLLTQEEEKGEEIQEGQEAENKEAVDKDIEEQKTPGGEEQSDSLKTDDISENEENATEQPQGCGSVGVLVIDNGRILTGLRLDNGKLCGPGGHIEKGETPEQAAIRESQEEFGITPNELIPLGQLNGLAPEYGAPYQFLCNSYTGTATADGKEMSMAKFLEPEIVLEWIDKGMAFEPFAESIKYSLSNLLTPENPKDTMKEKVINEDGGPGSGNHGHSGVPGQIGGSAPSGPVKDLEDAITSGRVSTKLNSKKQRKHTKGSTSYQKAIAQGKKVSVVTVSDSEVQALITKYSGKGHIYSLNGQFKETFEHTSPIGVHTSMNGKESETRRGTIHYAKDGAHIVPASPKGGSK